jgi:hypothetical protein
MKVCFCNCNDSTDTTMQNHVLFLHYVTTYIYITLRNVTWKLAIFLRRLLTSLSKSRLYSVGWEINDYELEEGSGCCLIEFLSRNLPGRSEENHEKPEARWSVSRPRMEPRTTRIQVSSAASKYLDQPFRFDGIHISGHVRLRCAIFFLR